MATMSKWTGLKHLDGDEGDEEAETIAWRAFVMTAVAACVAPAYQELRISTTASGSFPARWAWKEGLVKALIGGVRQP